MKRPATASRRLQYTLAGLTLMLLLAAFQALNRPHGFDRSDGSMFIAWSQTWQRGVQNIYHDPRINYPFLGVAASAGVYAALHEAFPQHDSDALLADYKWFIFFVDGLNLGMLAAVMTLLHIPTPKRFALLIALLPSSWVGGAAWGQIDSITLMFLWVSVWLFARVCLESADTDISAARAPSANLAAQHYFQDSYLMALASLSASLGVLTKQLFLFSLAGIALLAIMAARALWLRYQHRAWAAYIGAALTFVTPVLAVDAYVDVPAPFASHLTYVLWGPGPTHGNILSDHGLNIWALSAAPMGSALDPIVPGVTYQAAGVGLYLIILSALIYHGRQRFFGTPQSFAERRVQMASAIVLIGLANLAFNVLLTGCHERYLFHAYPCLILGLLFFINQGWVSKKRLMLIMLTAAAYGAYVWVIMSLPVKQDYNLANALQIVLAIVHASMLVSLMTWWRRVPTHL